MVACDVGPRILERERGRETEIPVRERYVVEIEFAVRTRYQETMETSN